MEFDAGMLIAMGFAAIAAALMCAAGVLWLKGRELVPTRAISSLRRKSLAELVVIVVIVGGFVQYGATKGTRGADGAEPHPPNVAAREDAIPPGRAGGGEELRFAAVEPYTNGVALAIALPAGGVADNTLDLFCTTNLLSSWSFIGEFLAGASAPTAEVFVACLDLPGAPVAMPSAAFFVAGTHDDADGDGIYDGRERIVYGTDPMRPDTDGDGLSDGCEVAIGTSPHLRDTDGDGYPDDEEAAAATNPLSPNAGAATSIRYVYDDDDRIVAAYAGAGGGASVTRWTPSGDTGATTERCARE